MGLFKTVNGDKYNKIRSIRRPLEEVIIEFAGSCLNGHASRWKIDLVKNDDRLTLTMEFDEPGFTVNNIFGLTTREKTDKTSQGVSLKGVGNTDTNIKVVPINGTSKITSYNKEDGHYGFIFYQNPDKNDPSKITDPTYDHFHSNPDLVNPALKELYEKDNLPFDDMDKCNFLNVKDRLPEDKSCTKFEVEIDAALYDEDVDTYVKQISEFIIKNQHLETWSNGISINGEQLDLNDYPKIIPTTDNCDLELRLWGVRVPWCKGGKPCSLVIVYGNLENDRTATSQFYILKNGGRGG